MISNFTQPSSPQTMTLLDGLRGTRDRLRQGWVRNHGAINKPGGGLAGLAFCVNGAAWHTDTLGYGRLLAALEAQIPESFRAPACDIEVKCASADDIGNCTGISRGNTPETCLTATFNNLAPSKQVVLDWVERAIASEQARLDGLSAAKFLEDLKSKLTAGAGVKETVDA